METIKKQYMIIGGGISGLSVLHFLRKSFGNEENLVSLLEKEKRTGGTIQTIVKDDIRFETGPDGFLNTAPHTHRLAEDLNLTGDFILAKKDAQIRYICINNRLMALPLRPQEILSFPALNLFEKIRIFGDLFLEKSSQDDMSVYDFVSHRFGKRMADVVVDPFISGIYAGDAKDTSMKAAFPQVLAWEKEFGSVFRALKQLKKQETGEHKSKVLMSFRKGMEQLIDQLSKCYEKDIKPNTEIDKVTYDGLRYCLHGHHQCFLTENLFLCTPAYNASYLVRELDASLSVLFSRIKYVPVAVVGLVFDRNALPSWPKGFGYLNPSQEKKEALGVLFENNIFENRCSDQKILLRVMLGGSYHPEVAKMDENELVNRAMLEVRNVLKIKATPIECFLVFWPKAIPQYDLSYPMLQEKIEKKLSEWKNLFLVSNFFKGVGFNDCITNAYLSVENLKNRNVAEPIPL